MPHVPVAHWSLSKHGEPSEQIPHQQLLALVPEPLPHAGRVVSIVHEWLAVEVFVLASDRLIAGAGGAQSKLVTTVDCPPSPLASHALPVYWHVPPATPSFGVGSPEQAEHVTATLLPLTIAVGRLVPTNRFSTVVSISPVARSIAPWTAEVSDPVVGSKYTTEQLGEMTVAAIGGNMNRHAPPLPQSLSAVQVLATSARQRCEITGLFAGRTGP